MLSSSLKKLVARNAGALARLAYDNDANKATIADAGGIPPLVALVHDGTEIQKTQAALALMRLAAEDTNAVAIAAAGGIPPLVALARDGTEKQKEHATGALGNLTANVNNQVAIADASTAAGRKGHGARFSQTCLLL